MSEGKLLEGSDRRRRILTLALPIIVGMLSQNVLNLVDTGFVGGLGDDALAGVGLGGFLNFLASALVLGISAGVQAMSARRLGEGRRSEAAIPLNGGLLIVLGFAVPWSALLHWLAPNLFALVTHDAAVLEQGVPYLRARLVGMLAMGANFAFRGFWNGTDRSKLYMRTLVTMHLTNIALDWVLIYGHLGAPAMGAEGAGVASSIATYVGMAQYIYLGLKTARGEGFLRGLPDRESFLTIARLSLPASLQQLFFAGGMTLFMVFVGRVGTMELAASKVMVDLLLVAILPSLGFGLAAASLVGQALGRGQVDDAKRWGWDVMRLAMVVSGVIGLPALLMPEVLLGIFLHDPTTLALAVTPMRIVGASLAFDSVGLVLMNAMLGAGDSRRVLGIALGLQWGIFLPVVWFLGPHLGLGLTVIWLAQVVYRLLQALAFSRAWAGGAWAEAKV
ncbi:MAG: MATE family efflux transporter [Deltaproteobacteria bacterium]|nr:MATE family efflux transporter [Deltaproteobacteria bacterium]